MKRSIFLLIVTIFFSHWASAWGFYGHQKINRMAVFTLPIEMVPFFKYHIQYLTENSVNPDRRRYAVQGEAPRHYIDVDLYGDSAVFKMPRYWNDAVAQFTEDTLQKHGIVPWHINTMKYRLTDAFRRKDVMAILRLAADMGHYIGDANVPLHTTANYNGQFTGQYGIHGFWESRLPELFSEDYDFFVGRADYISNPQLRAWDAVIDSHMALDSVLRFEKELTKRFSDDKKYGYELRGNVGMKVYSRGFSEAYHNMLAGQVERKMRMSIKMVGDFWYTCWVDAGQPNLTELLDIELDENFLKPEVIPDVKIEGVEQRNHESGIGMKAHDPCCSHPTMRYALLPTPVRIEE